MKTTPLAAAVLSLLATSCTFQARAHAERVLEVDHVEGSALRVTSRNGSIEVRAGAPGPKVRIEARITATATTMTEARKRLDAVVVSCDRDADRALVVEARFPDEPRGGDGVSYVIEVPDATNAVLKTSNGRITTHNVAGLVEARSSNGRLEISGPTAGVIGRSSNGSIRIDEAAGPVDVHTSNGSVDVKMQKDQKGPLDIRTSNGSVSVEVGPAFEGRIGVSTSNGKVHVHNESDAKLVSDLERNRGTIHFTDDQRVSRIHSSNGSVTVRVKD